MQDMIKDAVRDNYGALARGRAAMDDGRLDAVARAFGYSADELASLPAGANLGVSCGNPHAMASIREGEVVVDLGSGGGLDVFLAARTVGPAGRAIGIDMTEDMVALARRNAEKGGYANVEFHHAAIEAMPLAAGSADCVISNCVINLVPDKAAAYAEIFRILKPGGRLAISDIALKAPLPEALASAARAWTACIAGAVSVAETRAGLEAAGFADIAVIDAGADLNVYKTKGGTDMCCAPAPQEAAASSCCAPAPKPAASGCCGAGTSALAAIEAEGDFHEGVADLFGDIDLNDYAASVKIFAVKPS
jgi:arsenite methyltransferase